MAIGQWTVKDKAHWVPFRNDSGEEIPPYSVLQISGTTSIGKKTYFTVVKCSSADEAWYPVNGEAAVSSNTYGECTFTPQAIVAFAGDVPDYGDEAGPVPDEWPIGSGGKGFFILGPKSST